MLYSVLADISEISSEQVCLLRNRIEHFFFDKKTLKRKESVCAKALLSDILKSEFGLTDFNVLCDKNGKPYIENSTLHFNLSHSGDSVLCLCGTEKVGCDIQMMCEYKEKVAKRFFTENEYNFLCESYEKELDFTRIWTMKESILKYHGDGLSGGLSSYDFSGYVKKDSFEAYGLKFNLSVKGEYVICICSETDDIQFVTESDCWQC